MVTRTLWVDPGFGAAGDMILGALLGLGAPIDKIRTDLETLEIPGWTLQVEPTQRCQLSSTRALVTTEEDHHHRTWSFIDTLLADSSLPETVKTGSRATFRRLGEVEAAIHNVSIDEVHFHEVGAVDAIVDIAGSWLALNLLDIGRVVCGPIGMGHGVTEAAHGRLPIPAPATAALLIGAPVQPVDVAAETVTPTGAALLTTMATDFGPLPTGVMAGLARGAGGRNPDHYPNVVTTLLIEDQPTPAAPADRGVDGVGAVDGVPESVLKDVLQGVTVETAVVLTTNIDDLTPELVANTIDRCLAAGAADAWATPITMKKGRPAVEVNVLCQPENSIGLRDLLYRETGTLGIRSRTVEKHVAPRRFDSVTVRGHTVAIKVGPFGAKPEYEDVAAAAKTLDIPVRTLWHEALAQYQAETSG